MAQLFKSISEVENPLAGVPRLRQQVGHATARRAVLARSLGYARDRYQAGYASYLEELDVQRKLYQVELGLVTLQRTQIDNLIGLYPALGGGCRRRACLDAILISIRLLGIGFRWQGTCYGWVEPGAGACASFNR